MQWKQHCWKRSLHFAVSAVLYMIVLKKCSVLCVVCFGKMKQSGAKFTAWEVFNVLFSKMALLTAISERAWKCFEFTKPSTEQKKSKKDKRLDYNGNQPKKQKTKALTATQGLTLPGTNPWASAATLSQPSWCLSSKASFKKSGRLDSYGGCSSGDAKGANRQRVPSLLR